MRATDKPFNIAMQCSEEGRLLVAHVQQAINCAPGAM